MFDKLRHIFGPIDAVTAVETAARQRTKLIDRHIKSTIAWGGFVHEEVILNTTVLRIITEKYQKLGYSVTYVSEKCLLRISWANTDIEEPHKTEE